MQDGQQVGSDNIKEMEIQQDRKYSYSICICYTSTSTSPEIRITLTYQNKMSFVFSSQSPVSQTSESDF